MSQTTTPSIGQAAGFNGMLADGYGSVRDIVSSVAVAAPVGIGKLVVTDQVNGDDAARLPASAADINNLAKGVAVHAQSQETTLEVNPVWPLNSAFPTLQKGRIYVAVEDAVESGQPAFVRFQAGNEGGFRSDVDTANAVQLQGSKFRSSTTGAGIAIVELNLPA